MTGLPQALLSFSRTVHPLRALLLLVAAVVVVMAPFSEGPVQYSGWAMFPTLIAPVFMVTLLFVLPLDMVMSAVFMSGAEDGKRARYKLIIRSELALMAVMIIAWIPFLRSLLLI